MWWVLHHFKNPFETFKKLSKEFDWFIIRESIDDKRIFELWHKLNEEKLTKILSKVKLKPTKIVKIKKNKSLIIFIDKTNK